MNAVCALYVLPFSIQATCGCWKVVGRSNEQVYVEGLTVKGKQGDDDWERHTTIVREALAFWHSLKQVFLKVQDIFLANQGYGHHSVFGWMNCQLGALFQRRSVRLSSLMGRILPIIGSVTQEHIGLDD